MPRSNVSSADSKPSKGDDYLGEVFMGALNVANRLADEDSDISLSQSEFLAAIEDIGLDQEFDYEYLFENPDQVPNELEATGFGSKDSYSSVIRNVDHFQFCGFTALMLHYIKEGIASGAGELFKNHSESFGSSDYKPYMLFFESYAIQKNPYIREFDERIDAVTIAKRSVKECPDHYLVYLNASESILEAYEHSPNYEEKIENDTEIDEDLLPKALNYSNKSIRLKSDFSRGQYTKARAAILNHEFSQARTAIDKAKQQEQDERTPSYLEEENFDRIDQKLLIYTTQYQSEERIKDLDNAVDKARNKMESLQDEFETSLERFRSNSIQFIGFFAAIITLAVTSTNVIVNADRTLVQDAGLITILTGGLLVGFGAFGILLPNTANNKENLRDEPDRESDQENREKSGNQSEIAAVIILGFLLMILGWSPALYRMLG